jgi:hypothetical protein
MIEQAGQNAQRVSVIFDDQNPQALSRFGRSLRWIVPHLKVPARQNAL